MTGTMADSPPYKEQRRYARHPGPFDAISPDNHMLHGARVMNLGLGGCFIVGGSHHAVGATFMLINRGDEGLLDVSATTLYHTELGSAVTFMNLSQRAFGQIQRTVDASWAKPSP